MKKCRITVMRKTFYKDLSDMYENPILHTCDMEEGQVFTADRLKNSAELRSSEQKSLSPLITK